MTVESAWPSDRPRSLHKLAVADSIIRHTLTIWPTGPIASRLEIASHNLAEAAALIEKGE